MKLSRVRLRDIFCLSIVRWSVEFPNIIIERWCLFSYEYPWCAVFGDCCPAFVVDASVTEHLKVLELMVFRGFGVIERVRHAHALHGVLPDAIHRTRLWDSGHIENGWSNVNHVVELRSDLASRFNAARPVNYGTVPSAAPM